MSAAVGNFAMAEWRWNENAKTTKDGAMLRILLIILVALAVVIGLMKLTGTTTEDLSLIHI